MFSEMLSALRSGRGLDEDTLRKRYDFAMTKKLGVVKLPPAFWSRDPNINPLSEHLFWAALLLKDREKIDLAISVIAIEIAETNTATHDGSRQNAEGRARELVDELLGQFADSCVRQEFICELHSIVPDMLNSATGKS